MLWVRCGAWGLQKRRTPNKKEINVKVSCLLYYIHHLKQTSIQPSPKETKDMRMDDHKMSIKGMRKRKNRERRESNTNTKKEMREKGKR